MVERNLGGLDVAILAGHIIDRRYFVRMDFKTDPPGILAFCNKPGGFTGDINDTLVGIIGGSREWIESDFRLQKLSQTQNDILTVSAIDFSNGTPGNKAIDGYWSDIIQRYTIHETAVGIWSTWFDITDDSFLAAWPIFIGQIDATDSSQRTNFSLTPFTTTHAQLIPAREYSATCANEYNDAETCQVDAGVLVDFPTCPKTMTACIERQNIIHFTGFPFLPPPNSSLIWGASGARFQPG